MEPFNNHRGITKTTPYHAAHRSKYAALLGKTGGNKIVRNYDQTTNDNFVTRYCSCKDVYKDEDWIHFTNVIILQDQTIESLLAHNFRHDISTNLMCDNYSFVEFFINEYGSSIKLEELLINIMERSK